MSTQNTSSAVMQQRHEPHTSLDDFPTPPWATRALIEHVIGDCWGNYRVTEPACNRGHMVKPLSDSFYAVDAFDIHDYGCGFVTKDYLLEQNMPPTDWTITNPPFKLAEQFIQTALEHSTVGVAIFIRSAFAESIGRYNRLFKDNPPSTIAQFSERVVLHKGKLTATGSTATAYCWMVWNKISPMPYTRFVWIPPCRKELEKASDYEGNE